MDREGNEHGRGRKITTFCPDFFGGKDPHTERDDSTVFVRLGWYFLQESHTLLSEDCRVSANIFTYFIELTVMTNKLPLTKRVTQPSSFQGWKQKSPCAGLMPAHVAPSNLEPHAPGAVYNIDGEFTKTIIIQNNCRFFPPKCQYLSNSTFSTNYSFSVHECNGTCYETSAHCVLSKNIGELTRSQQGTWKCPRLMPARSTQF